MEGSPGKIGLSTLPDDVILHIMSFLTTRQAVRTCVLSRLWRNLWRTVPLDLEDINGWITHAVQKQPWVLDILVLYDALKLDHSVFTCCYLTKIKFINVLIMPGFFQQLETGCPVLENLFLDESIVADVEISSQTLKILTIKNTLFSYDYRTTMSTPSVTYLKLWNPVNGTCVFNGMPLLVTSFLVLDDVQDSSDFLENLRSLSAAKSLEFNYIGRKICLLVLHIPLSLLYPCILM